jgi:hypothetical protein
VKAKFVNGKPQIIEAKFNMRSQLEWDRFMRFMDRWVNKHYRPRASWGCFSQKGCKPAVKTSQRADKFRDPLGLTVNKRPYMSHHLLSGFCVLRYAESAGLGFEKGPSQ